MNGQPSETSSGGARRTAKGIPPRVLWIGGAALGSVLAVLIAWQVGVHQSRAEVERLSEELTRADARLNALEARRLLHRAVLQLESRNFGSAQERVDGAKRFLAASQELTEDAALADLLAQVEAFQTNVDPNVGKQVARLAQLMTTLDEHLPTPELPHGAPPPEPPPEPPRLEDGAESAPDAQQ